MEVGTLSTVAAGEDSVGVDSLEASSSYEDDRHHYLESLALVPAIDCVGSRAVLRDCGCSCESHGSR